jgi:simple sugar transport system ATP-binding protein
MRSRIDQLNDEFGFTLDPHERADTLSVVGLQQLEILKVLATGASILLLDEPTGSLAPGQARDFLLLVRKLVERRRSVVLITHKLDDALNHADTITVLKQGRVTWSQDAKEYDEETLATAMLGRQPPTVFLTPNVVGKVVVQAADLEVRPLRGKGPGLTSATFEVRAGETIGVAAVEGNGERELLWSVAGLLPPVRGRLNVQGPATLIPEDRATGLIPDFTLIDNLTLGLGEKSPWVHRGIIYPGRAYEGGAEILTRHGVLAPGPHTRAGWLSGGNQQKLMLARALESKPRVILAENPGRGLDLRASHTAFEQFRKAAHDGAAVLIHSSDLEELLEWCDRIVVVAGGKVYHPAEKTQASIGRLMVATGTS